MNNMISRPEVYLSNKGDNCFVCFDIKIKNESKVRCYNIITDFKDIDELKACHDTHLEIKSKSRSILTNSYIKQNNPAKPMCFIFTYKHLLHFIQAFMKTGMSIKESILESLTIITNAQFPKYMQKYTGNTPFIPFGKKITEINTNNSTKGSIVMDNGSFTEVEISGEFNGKLMCVKSNKNKELKNKYKIVLCNSDKVRLIRSEPTLQASKEENMDYIYE